ncbi:DUF4178 domain-containing protein [Streptomyces sodiiphilus]|uniref:DUF4178 domain-containing protein n=1 Tax=Streptomyces sodiiphilus TaxID=226217 RepID=A0ABN2PB60_9ACTN
MEFVLTVAVLAGLAAAVVVVLRSMRGTGRTEPPVPADPFADEGATSGDPRTLKAGDMVEYLGERLFVRGSLRLTEGGFSWSEHYLDAMDGPDGTRRWLSVEEDPDLEVVLWTPHSDPELVPSRKELTVEGVTYRRTEHGTATYSSEGTTGLGETGRVEYADYEGPGGRSLAFERFMGAESGRGGWEASLGERIPNGTLVIYPSGDA